MTDETGVGSEGVEDTEAEEQNNITQEAAPAEPFQEAPAQATEISETPQAPPQAVEGRRTQLKIVRETVQSLSRDVGSFRKSHELSTKKLEKQVASLRKELAVHARSKDLSNHVKSHESDTKRLEKQVATLRNELVSIKSQIAKEAAKSRVREEAVLSKMLAKVRTTPKRSKKPPTKSSKKKR